MSDDEKNTRPSGSEDKSEPNKSRREVLRKVLVGGGLVAGASFLPDKWVKPVVDVIVVPAHAQTSAAATCVPGESACPTTSRA